MSWRVLVQRSGVGAPQPQCVRYDVSGVPVPARIEVVACDATAAATADLVFRLLQTEVGRIGGRATPCGAAAGLGCHAWHEPACRHVLVLIIAEAALDPSYEQLASDWTTRSPFAQVLPALESGLTHNLVLGTGAFPTLAKLNASAWSGSPSRLAQEAMAAALLDERPAVFLSYSRRDGLAIPDAIEDALIADGHRVFLDRHSGTGGRPFPSELRDAIAGSDLVLVLETPQVRHSDWTRWEAAFAYHLRVGPVAVHFSNGTRVPHCRKRLDIGKPHTATLSSADISSIVDLVRRYRVALAVERRAHFDSLVTGAARSKGGSACTNGLLHTVRDRYGVVHASVLTSGVPARLRHVHRLAGASGPSRLLAGDHVHLNFWDVTDLRWLAGLTGVSLVGKAAIYRKIRSLLP